MSLNRSWSRRWKHRHARVAGNICNASDSSANGIHHRPKFRLLPRTPPALPGGVTFAKGCLARPTSLQGFPSLIRIRATKRPPCLFIPSSKPVWIYSSVYSLSFYYFFVIPCATLLSVFMFLSSFSSLPTFPQRCFFFFCQSVYLPSFVFIMPLFS